MPKESEDVYNILFVGIDSRDKDYTKITGRSDTMILASYNTRTNRITLISFMRDTEVWRFGEKRDRPTFLGKLNAAYQSGGAGELINTLNSERNFNLDIQKYVTIGFKALWNIVDAVGGVDVYLSKDEAIFINWRNAGLYKNDDHSQRKTQNQQHDRGNPSTAPDGLFGLDHGRP